MMDNARAIHAVRERYRVLLRAALWAELQAERLNAEAAPAQPPMPLTTTAALGPCER